MAAALLAGARRPAARGRGDDLSQGCGKVSKPAPFPLRVYRRSQDAECTREDPSPTAAHSTSRSRTDLHSHMAEHSRTSRAQPRSPNEAAQPLYEGV
jgi:hypothetical protein